MEIKLLISTLFVAVSTFACTKIDVPKAVQDAFNAKYPTAKKVEWEMEDKSEYEAEFKMDGKEMSANFKEDGTWVGAETEIDRKDLPQAVINGIAAAFPDHKIEEVERSENPKGIIVYEVELENEKDGVEFKADFSEEGKFIKKEMEKDDNDGDEDENE